MTSLYKFFFYYLLARSREEWSDFCRNLVVQCKQLIASAAILLCRSRQVIDTRHVSFLIAKLYQIINWSVIRLEVN